MIVGIPYRFEQDQPPRLREGRERQQLTGAANEREAAAVELEARDALDDRRLGHEHEPRGVEHRLERAKRRRRHEHRLDDEPAIIDQPFDDEASFSDEQAVLLEPRRLTDVTVGLKPRIVVAIDLVNQSSLRWTDRRLRWLSMTCWPSRLLRNTFDSPQSTGWGTKRITSKASCARVLRIS